MTTLGGIGMVMYMTLLNLKDPNLEKSCEKKYLIIYVVVGEPLLK